jgi:hypothetical protein
MDLSCSPGVEAYADDGTDSGGSLGCYMPNDGAPVNPYSGGGGSGRQSACELGYWSQCPPNYFWGGQSPYCSYGFVDFSSGCESDAAAYANAWPKWYNIVNFQEDGYILRTDPTHYWNKHLACYLPGTSQAFTSAAAGNFFLFVYVPGRAPALQTYEDYNFVYEGFVVTYRIFKVSQGFYALTTAFLVKYNNCPGY